jgi:hypothetical protein
MTRIVFASCMTARKKKDQKVWDEAIAHQPDWLILGGDNIYMDYWPNLGQSKKWSLQRFAEEMETRYRKQFSLASFRRIVESIPERQVIGVWDDHDFAWDNCHGADLSYEMADKKKIATAYYHHYFRELNKRPLAKDLPALPIADLKNPPDGTRNIYRGFDMPEVRVLLCDGRSWRSEHPIDGAKSDLLGAAQEAWLFSELSSHPGPFMLVSGSTMTDSSAQAWDYFREFYQQRFLPAVQDKLVLFVAGDVHRNRLPPRNGSDPIEIVSSACGLKFPFNDRNFGVIDLNGSSAAVWLYKRGKIQFTSQLVMVTGAYTTTMSALLDDSVKAISIQEATEQRAEAMRKLQMM